MRRRLVLMAALAATASLAAAATAGAGGGTFNIAFEDNRFVPATSLVTTTGNSTFEWDRAPGSTNRHNIRQDDKLFRSGDPSASFDSYTRKPSAGTFHYYCEKHGGPHSGMQGKLRVTPVGGSKSPPGTFRILWASADTNTGDAFDVRFRVNGGNWRDWKNDTTKFGGLFGNNDRPVNVRPGKEYDFKARSEKSSNPNKRSRWSPPLGPFEL